MLIVFFFFLFCFEMINSKLETSQLKFRIPKSGTASLVFVMTLPTSREKTVCDSSIVTPAKYLVKFGQFPCASGSRKQEVSWIDVVLQSRSSVPVSLVSNWVLGKIGWEYRGESLIKLDHRGLILNDIFWLNLLAENTTHKLEHTRIRVPDLQAYKY